MKDSFNGFVTLVGITAIILGAIVLAVVGYQAVMTVR